MENNTTKSELSYVELIAIIRPNSEFELDWQVNEENTVQTRSAVEEDLYDRYRQNPDKTLLYLGFFDENPIFSASLKFLYYLSNTFVRVISMHPEIETLRENITLTILTKSHIESPNKSQSEFHGEPQIEPITFEIEKILANAPYMNGLENLDYNWIIGLWGKLCHVFSSDISSFSGTVEEYFSQYNSNIHVAGRVFFHLVESKNDDFPFAFLATYSTLTSKEGKSKHVPLKNALVEYGKNSSKLLELLSTVYRASSRSSLIEEILESGEIFHPLNFTAMDAYSFLKEIPLYEESGILCRIPNWWKNRSESLRMTINIGSKTPSRVGYDALVDFDAKLSLGGENISPAEIRKLLAESEGLMMIKGKWIEIDHKKLSDTLAAYEQAQNMLGDGEMSLIEAMKFQLNAKKVLDIPTEKCELEITNGKWLNTVINGLTRPETIDNVGCGMDFNANLRQYQERGLSWLHFMKTLGLGACLADDMGLGKTVQVLALLNYIRSKNNEKALLVVPASLVGNWISEIYKFAPSLRHCILHPSENSSINEADTISTGNFDLFITTYGMLQKLEWLKNTTWDTLILDEAQAIKNPGTKQTKTVKTLKSKFKIAMTGTPIENRLSDLWSLFDFLNKGLLGTAKEFTDFAKQLKVSRDGYVNLKKVVSPFILRRLKTDKSIISDLPEKIEMKTYSTLTGKQVALYTSLVKELKEKLENTAEGIQRKGLVLASIMKFKQICNHPDQYLGQNYYSEKESGKYEILREICETIYQKRERVLVFTQFKEITTHLSDFLENVFMHKGLVLNGETPIAKRKEIVDKFQGHDYVPYLVLSIKAGGVGLNLTGANHVIHFDRWWNPAVENQATDRAFRIGQKRNVIVHKFITKGTIEEKIDLMIEDKTKLSKDIIPDIQENWITEMDNAELMNLFKLTI